MRSIARVKALLLVALAFRASVHAHEKAPFKDPADLANFAELLRGAGLPD